MPEFEYQGVDRSGKKVSGKLTVDAEGDLRMLLRSQGVRPTQVRRINLLQQDLGQMLGGSSNSISREELTLFTRQLQVLISSGVPLVQSLDVLFEQSSNRATRTVVAGVKERVSGGSFFWESLSAYPNSFSRIYIALIRAGESSGSLDNTLMRLSRYLEDTNRLIKAIKGASMYPAIVISIGIMITMGLLVFVIPKFEGMLKSSNQELPALTKALVALSHWMSNNIIFVIAGMAGGIYLFLRYIKTEEGRTFLDRFLFEIPVLGPLMQKAAVARFARTMQSLLSSGVSLLDAIDICKETIDNAVIEEAIVKIRSEVEGGKTIGMVASRLAVFPKMAAQMIIVGESTGNLDKMLDKIAEFYEEEVEIAVQSMSKLMEPVLLVVLGALVGGMLLAMYLPIFKSVGAAMG